MSTVNAAHLGDGSGVPCTLAHISDVYTLPLPLNAESIPYVRCKEKKKKNQHGGSSKFQLGEELDRKWGDTNSRLSLSESSSSSMQGSHVDLRESLSSTSGIAMTCG